MYLALDSCIAAGTGLRVTEDSAVAAAVLPGHSDGPQLMFLFYVDLLHPGWTKQGPALFGGQRLQKEVLIYLRVVQIDVIVGDVFCRQSVGFFRLNGAVLSQLKKNVVN